MQKLILGLCFFSQFLYADELKTDIKSELEPQLIHENKLNLAFINLRSIMINAPQNNSIRERLEKEFKEEQKDLLESQAELAKLEQQLLIADQSENNSDLELKVINKRRDLNQRDKKIRENYNIRRNEEMIELQKLIMDEIISLAEEKKYDVILNETGVVFVSKEADITSEVLQRLKEKGNK